MLPFLTTHFHFTVRCLHYFPMKVLALFPSSYFNQSQNRKFTMTSLVNNNICVRISGAMERRWFRRADLSPSWEAKLRPSIADSWASTKRLPPRPSSEQSLELCLISHWLDSFFFFSNLHLQLSFSLKHFTGLLGREERILDPASTSSPGLLVCGNNPLSPVTGYLEVSTNGLIILLCNVASNVYVT